MLKSETQKQLDEFDFMRAAGIHLNPENRWVEYADRIPWDKLEDKYAGFFHEYKNPVTSPVRLAIACLLIQDKYQYSDEDLLAFLKENVYYQFFIGLKHFSYDIPLNTESIAFFRNILVPDIISDVKEMIRKEG